MKISSEEWLATNRVQFLRLKRECAKKISRIISET